jgi:hypothetical protein
MKMKKSNFWLGMLVMILAFVACESPNDEPAHVHDYQWTVTTPATCIATGEESGVCKLDPSHTTTREIPIDLVNGHDWGEWEGTVTCTEAGTGTRVCSRSETHTETNNDLQPLGHNYQNWTTTTASTCTTEGEETGTCTHDNTHNTTRSKAIDPNAHNWQPLPTATAPTCTVDGNGDQICSYNEEHIQSGVIPKLGHDYQNYTETTAPTCTTAGVETGICTHDATHTDTRAIALDPDAHDYQNWTETTAPTCTEAAIETGTCTHNSSHTDTRAGAAALGHDYQLVTIPPSAIEEGMDKEICSHDPTHIGETRNVVPSTLITNITEWNDAITLLNEKTGNYTLTIGGSFSVNGNYNSNTVSYANTFGTTPEGSALTVTLKGSGTLSLSNYGNILRVGANQTLIIDNEDLILQGRYGGNASLVYVSGANARLELKNGTITGNTHSRESNNATGGGVFVGGNATFTMSGGIISGNTATTTGNASNYTSWGHGGGVYVASNGTFNMSGGAISGNTATSTRTPAGGSGYGGGVYVAGSFNMSGGTISGNRADGRSGAYGGGVYVDQGATFTMIDGVISGNTAMSSTNGTGSGGGVCVYYSSSYNRGIFRIVNGTIYGSNEGDLSNKALTSATLYSSGGYSVYPATTGLLNGDFWVFKHYVSSSADTIDVVNGELEGVRDILLPSWRPGDTISLTAPTVVPPREQTITAQGWQISDDGSNWSDFTATTADMSYTGKSLRYYATFSDGKTYYSNTVTIRVYYREVTVAMWDRYNDGWNENAYVRININGTNTGSIRMSGGTSPSYSRFDVVAGDVVKIYWVRGGQGYFDDECAFAVYYTDDPPVPMFNPSSGSTSSKVLASMQYYGAPFALTQMGEFTVP